MSFAVWSILFECFSIVAPTEPTIILGTTVSSSQIDITWNEPKTWNGIPSKYVVEFGKNNTQGGLQMIDNIPINRQSQNISHLDVFTNYRFRVSLSFSFHWACTVKKG